MSFIHFLQRNKLMPVICIVIFLLIVGGTLLYLWQSGFFELVRNIDELKAYRRFGSGRTDLSLLFTDP